MPRKDETLKPPDSAIQGLGVNLRGALAHTCVPGSGDREALCCTVTNRSNLLPSERTRRDTAVSSYSGLFLFLFLFSI